MGTTGNKHAEKARKKTVENVKGNKLVQRRAGKKGCTQKWEAGEQDSATMCLLLFLHVSF